MFNSFVGSSREPRAPGAEGPLRFGSCVTSTAAGSAVRAMVVLVCALALVAMEGCGASLLPTTVAHVRLEHRAAADADFASFAGPRAELVTRTEVAPGEWLAWARSGEGEGRLARVVVTPIGLEAQAIGVHTGPAFRPLLRRWALHGSVIVAVESSASERSVDRSAWLYVEESGRLLPVLLDGAPLTITLHRDVVREVDAAWERERVVSAALRIDGGGSLVIDEHATEREQARGREGAAPRSVREVHRARHVTLVGAMAQVDRPSLLDEP